MKKKIISLLLAAVASAGALGLASCGDDNSNSPVDDGVLKSDKVASEAEWKAAFDFSNVTNATLYLSEDGSTHSQCEMIDGNKSYTIEEEDDWKDESYSRYEPDELVEHPRFGTVGTKYYYSYDSEAKKWTYSKGASESDATRDFRKTLSDCVDDFVPMPESYANFKWDENNYQYVATWDSFEDDMTNVKVTVKIKNGKLAAGTIEFDRKNEDDDRIEGIETVKLEFKIYDIGTTKVTLPQAEEEKD